MTYSGFVERAEFFGEFPIDHFAVFQAMADTLVRVRPVPGVKLFEYAVVFQLMPGAVKYLAELAFYSVHID
ncbi:hypothetical protein [Methylotuvimicrobium sp. KM1]|uniref:hypothetical protein n=1 Tax=Methylotuvimicrobium sp. KM1 TaxID=3377707 RepID=UPI00384E3172